MAFFWSFLPSPTTNLLKTCEVNVRQQCGGGSTACFTSLLKCGQIPITDIYLAALWQCHTRKTLLPQHAARYKSRCSKAQLLLGTDWGSPKPSPLLLHRKYRQFHLELCTQFQLHRFWAAMQTHQEICLCSYVHTCSYFSWLYSER